MQFQSITRQKIFFALLFVLGAVAWAWFFNFGDIPFDFHDWAEVNAPRLAFVQDAIRKNTLPLHMPDASALRSVTDRYFSLPDVFATPTLLLLKWLPVGDYIVAHVLILYALGFWGLLALRKLLGLSTGGFTFLFLVYNFNGHLMAHFSVGHVTWGGNFLLSWFFLWILELFDDRDTGNTRFSWHWSTKMASLLVFMFLNGSFHQFVWCLLFLMFLVLTFWERRNGRLMPDWRRWGEIFFAGLFSGLLSAVRILPVMIQMDGFDDDFLGGYRSLHQLINAFTHIIEPVDALNPAMTRGTLGWWEYDTFIGVAAIIVIAILAVSWLIYALVPFHDAAPRKPVAFPEILVPMFMLTLFSIGNVYALFRKIPIPLFAGERVSSRFLILPLICGVIVSLSCEETFRYRLFRGRSVIADGLLTGLTVVTGLELFSHGAAWRVTSAFKAFPYTRTDLTIKVVANHADPPYTTALLIGASISLLTVIIMALLVIYENRQRKQPRKDSNFS